MSQRTWTLRRHADSSGCVLVVASSLDALDALADAVAEAGYFAFAAIGAGIGHLLELAAFDLVVVLAGVEHADREALRRLQPAERLVEVAADDVETVLVALRMPRAN